MTPIHELFSRMRWDAAFAAGDFVTGYYDRVERKITEVPFGRVRLVPGDRFPFQASDPDGCAHEVPFRWVATIRRDGQQKCK